MTQETTIEDRIAEEARADGRFAYVLRTRGFAGVVHRAPAIPALGVDEFWALQFSEYDEAGAMLRSVGQGLLTGWLIEAFWRLFCAAWDRRRAMTRS